MKCSCGNPGCTSEVGFDSMAGILISESRDKRPIGLYLSVADAVTLGQQLRAYILRAIETPRESLIGDIHKGAHE